MKDIDIIGMSHGKQHINSLLTKDTSITVLSHGKYANPIHTNDTNVICVSHEENVILRV